jgi:hypothetical protein
MDKIKKFLDYITGYTSYQSKLNRMVNRTREYQAGPQVTGNSQMTADEILETFSMIKDYLTLLSDTAGVQVIWPRYKKNPTALLQGLGLFQFETNYLSHTITSLNNFIIHAQLKISKDVDMKQFQLDFESCKSQLKAEDFILEWHKPENPYHVQELIVRHISCPTFDQLSKAAKFTRRFA